MTHPNPPFPPTVPVLHTVQSLLEDLQHKMNEGTISAEKQKEVVDRLCRLMGCQ